MNKLFFDIETIADPAAIAMLPEPKAPGNLKDPEKIAAAIAEKKAEQISMAALDPDIATIKAISFSGGALNFSQTLIVDKEHDEKFVIGYFWEAFTKMCGFSCGYNILGFDWPFVMRRTMCLGLGKLITIRPALAKYRTEPTLDLMGVLYNWDKAKSLKFVAKRYGLEVLAHDVDGSMVAQMSDEDIRAYCLSDLWITIQLHDLMQGVYF